MWVDKGDDFRMIHSDSAEEFFAGFFAEDAIDFNHVSLGLLTFRKLAVLKLASWCFPLFIAVSESAASAMWACPPSDNRFANDSTNECLWICRILFELCITTGDWSRF